MRIEAGNLLCQHVFFLIYLLCCCWCMEFKALCAILLPTRLLAWKCSEEATANRSYNNINLNFLGAVTHTWSSRLVWLAKIITLHCLSFLDSRKTDRDRIGAISSVCNEPQRMPRRKRPVKNLFHVELMAQVADIWLHSPKSDDLQVYRHTNHTINLEDRIICKNYFYSSILSKKYYNIYVNYFKNKWCITYNKKVVE